MTFLDWNNALLDEQQAAEGGNAVPPIVSARNGYTFTGWDKDYTNVQGDLTLTAQYTPTAYSINYLLGGGTNAAGNPSSYTIESNTITLANPTYPNGEYVFKGWSPSNTIPQGSTRDRTFSANWTKLDYPNGSNKPPVMTYLLDGITFIVDSSGGGSNIVFFVTVMQNGVTLVPRTQATIQKLDPGTGSARLTVGAYSIIVYIQGNELNGNVDPGGMQRPYNITWKNHDGAILKTETVNPGVTPAYTGTAPTKPSTDEYIYTHTGWTPTPVAANEDASYTAVFTPAINTYTVIWQNYDGSALETDTNVPFGTLPTYDSALPTRAADAQYTYAFSGWTPAVTTVSGPAVYTATYAETVNAYTVIWENDDGSLLETDLGVLYGAIPTYDGATPVSPANAQYTYTFAGWSPTVTTVSRPAVYKATFTRAINTYKVTWLDEDGTELQVNPNEPYGSYPPAYSGLITPSRAATAQYTYTHSGWSPDPATTIVTGDLTLRPTFTPTTNTYTVIWQNYDGEELETDFNVPFGTLPTYDGATPAKPADAQYTYAFSGWTPTVTTVSGPAVYKATFTPTTNTYKVTWLDDDGTELQVNPNVPYGSYPPAYSGLITPSRAATAQYTYTHSGWSPDPATTTVTGDLTLRPTFTPAINTYTVIWQNYDGSALETDTNVPFGTMPTYDGATPVRDPDAQYTYTFLGWSPDILNVAGNVTYTATYAETVNAYTVIWQDFDGTELETDLDVPFGTLPTYDGALPTRAADAQYTYTFLGWSPDILNVAGNVTYTATYAETVNAYTVIWENDDGSLLETDLGVLYGAIPTYDGATPTKAATADFMYAFAGWMLTVSPVLGDISYVAYYTPVPIEDVVVMQVQDPQPQDPGPADPEPAPAAAAVVPAANPPAPEPVDRALEPVEEDPVPLAAPTEASNTWALLNLALAVLALGLSAYLAVALLKRQKKIDDPAQTAADKQPRMFWRIIAMVAGVGSCLSLLLTQSFLDPMSFVNEWTPLMVAIGLVQIAAMLLMDYMPKKAKAKN